MTKQFGWSQAPATISRSTRPGTRIPAFFLVQPLAGYPLRRTPSQRKPFCASSRWTPVSNSARNCDHRTPLERLPVTQRVKTMWTPPSEEQRRSQRFPRLLRRESIEPNGGTITGQVRLTVQPSCPAKGAILCHLFGFNHLRWMEFRIHTKYRHI
jgi:hypothetical protein